MRRVPPTALAVLLAAAVLATATGLAADAAAISVGKFSAARAGGPFPEGWRPLEFPKIARHTRYDLVEDEGRVALRARSDAAASGLVRKLRVDLAVHPVLAWSWKVENLIDGADVRTKAGDDYPARLYVTFEYHSEKVGFFEMAKFEAARLLYGEYPPIAAINYIWEGRAPAGTVVANAYTPRVRMIVVESGASKLGRWVAEERNLLEDYRSAFAEEPPAVSGIAVMTDTDNTGAAATAFYGDVEMRRSAGGS